MKCLEVIKLKQQYQKIKLKKKTAIPYINSNQKALRELNPLKAVKLWRRERLPEPSQRDTVSTVPFSCQPFYHCTLGVRHFSFYLVKSTNFFFIVLIFGVILEKILPPESRQLLNWGSAWTALRLTEFKVQSSPW